MTPEPTLVTTASNEAGASILRVGPDGRLSHLQNIDLPNRAGSAWWRMSAARRSSLFLSLGKIRCASMTFTAVTPTAPLPRPRPTASAMVTAPHTMLNTPLYGDSWQAAGKTFIVMPACRDHGMATYELTSSGRLVLKDSVRDGESSDYLFRETMSARAVEIDGQHYIFVSGSVDSGITMFSVDDDGRMEWVESVPDTASVALNSWARYAFTTDGNGDTVMAVAGVSDDGISLFDLGYEDFRLDPAIPVIPEV